MMITEFNNVLIDRTKCATRQNGLRDPQGKMNRAYLSLYLAKILQILNLMWFLMQASVIPIIWAEDQNQEV